MIEHNIQVDHDLKIIFAVVSGIFTEDNYKEVCGKACALSSEIGYHAFYDLVDTKFTLSVDVSARLPRETHQECPSNARKSRIALLVHPRDYSKWKFIEMINHGMGFKTCPFMNKEDAMAWLFS